MKKIKLLPYQVEFMMSQHPETLLLGGIGTGKTKVLAYDLINNMKKYRGIEVLLAANTYSQLMTATVKTLCETLDELNIPYKKVESGARKRIEVLGGVVYLYSLEKYDNIRGIEVGLIYLDEICFSCVEALQVVRGRLRGKIGPLQIKGTSSPNGFNFIYDIFEGKDVNPTPKTKLIRALTKMNRFLPAGYYEARLEEYGGEDTPLAKQELMGQFVNLVGGQIYNGFDRKNNIINCSLKPGYPVYVGVDFNIGKMSATYVQYINGIFYVCKEVQLEHESANTLDMARKIISDLQGYQVYLIPDSTGKNRHSAATSTQSDHQVLIQHGLTLMPTSNPFIRDRQNTVNHKFRLKQLFIDASCVKTVKEIETLSARDKEGELSHLAVTVGYVVWHLAPLKTSNGKSSTIHL